MCNQIPVKIKNSRANFSSKMSKLFRYVGRVHLIWTYVQIFVVFFFGSLSLNKSKRGDQHFSKTSESSDGGMSDLFGNFFKQILYIFLTPPLS